MASLTANNYKMLLANKEIDFGADTFKIMLMAYGYSFNRTTHDLYADVSASEVANGLGYTTLGNTLSGVAITQNDTLNAAVVTWSNTSWTATGGSIAAVGAIIYDDTVTDDPIICYIDFGGLLTAVDGAPFTIANISTLIS